MKLKRIIPVLIIISAAIGTATGAFALDKLPIDLSAFTKTGGSDYERTNIDYSLFPDYTGEAFIEINENIPALDKNDGAKEFQIYMDLDYLGRCTETYVNVSQATMPDKPRESIGMIKPSGWHLVKYDGIDGDYLFNRCHLVGYQLTGENANERNLITGTRFLNVEGMLPFENTVADYVQKTGHHVLYKVIPVFKGKNLVATGVWMQALSVEDDELAFNVFCYNVQPGIDIDYASGESQIVTIQR